MFGLGIRYLNGWAMAAADGARKEVAEWPPHPDRVFMALAATWFETGKNKEEGEILQWLEQLEPPELVVPDATYRTIQTSYVPINDDSAPIKTKNNKQVLFPPLTTCPIGRARQPRSFPVAIPFVTQIGDIPEIYLIWKTQLQESQCQLLSEICSKVAYIGHSSSFVQMWVTYTPPEPNLVPLNGITKYRLRVFGPGRLKYLEDKCGREKHIDHVDKLYQLELSASGREKNRLKKQREEYLRGISEKLRPEPGLWQGYGKPIEPPAEPLRGSVFDPRLIVLKLSGKQLGLHSTLKIVDALRGSLLSASPQPIPEWVSGHTPDGKKSENPHLAMLPLPFVGREHADGRLMGLGLAIPREINASKVEKALTPWLWDEHGLPRKIHLFNGQCFDCIGEIETRENPPLNLQMETWSKPSMCWATVTPLIFDKHFDGKDKWDRAAETIKNSCEKIGLPRPVEVMLSPVSMFEGVPRSNEFPWLTRKSDGGRMHHSHAVIVFSEKIQGPVIIGAGRYRGYGLFRPVRQGGKS